MKTDSTEGRKKHKSCTYDDRVLPNHGTGEAKGKLPVPRELNIGGQRPTVKLSVWSHGRQTAQKKLGNNRQFPVKPNQTINKTLSPVISNVKTMRSECCGCKKSFSGKGLIVTLNGEEQTYCADCLWKLQKEYAAKKTCEDCGSFDEESCGKTGRKLVPVKAGFNTYFAQAETCGNYSTEQKTTSKKKEESTEEQKEARALAKKLAEDKQTLTYFCCHCGSALKIGAKAPEIQETCPRCHGDLEIINRAKFIKQHQA